MKKRRWICTDPSCNQFREKLGISRFLFKEDRIIDPVTKKTEVFELEINLDEYSNIEIFDACRPFGYSDIQVEKWLTEGEEYELIAECIFEMSN